MYFQSPEFSVDVERRKQVFSHNRKERKNLFKDFILEKFLISISKEKKTCRLFFWYPNEN